MTLNIRSKVKFKVTKRIGTHHFLCVCNWLLSGKVNNNWDIHTQRLPIPHGISNLSQTCAKVAHFEQVKRNKIYTAPRYCFDESLSQITEEVTGQFLRKCPLLLKMAVFGKKMDAKLSEINEFLSKSIGVVSSSYQWPVPYMEWIREKLWPVERPQGNLYGRGGGVGVGGTTMNA